MSKQRVCLVRQAGEPDDEQQQRRRASPARPRRPAHGSIAFPSGQLSQIDAPSRHALAAARRSTSARPVKIFLNPRMIQSQQFRNRSDRDHFLVGQHRHPVADRIERVEVVGDQEHGQVEPLLQAIGSIRRNAAAPIGSSPAVGSSRNNSSGSSASARARPARLRMPPDSSDGYLGPASAGSPLIAIL